jgi:hypothetical protein
MYGRGLVVSTEWKLSVLRSDQTKINHHWPAHPVTAFLSMCGTMAQPEGLVKGVNEWPEFVIRQRGRIAGVLIVVAG